MNDPSFRSETDWGLPQVLDVEQFEQSLTDALQGEAEEAADPTEDMTAAPVKGFTLQALFPPKLSQSDEAGGYLRGASRAYTELGVRNSRLEYQPKV